MKKRKVFFIVIFVACMIAMPVLTVLGPYTNVSFYEQRGLAPIPQLTKAGVWDGSFFSDIETALTDHIAFRDGMVKNHTRLSMALERPVVSDLIVSSDVLLDYFGFYYWDIGYIDGQAAAAAEAYRELNDYITSYGGYFCFLGVPQQAIYFADHYPEYMDNRLWHTTAIRTAFSKYMAQEGVPFIDMYTKYRELGAPKDYYFETDHHSTYKGAYAAYLTLLERIRSETSFDIPVMTWDELRWSTLPNPFLGSANRKLYELWETSDRFEYVELKDPIPFERFDNGRKVESSVYLFPTTEAEDVTYSAYMGGDIGETVIRTNRPELKNALIFGDSYTNPIETLLWTGFNETRSLDYRYYDEKSLLEYIDEYQPDVVITVRDESVYLVGDGNGNILDD